MTTGVVAPDPNAFRELARRHRVVPVTRRLLADGETPVGVYRKLAGGPGTFLLESAEHGAASGGVAWSRYSFVGVRSTATLTERDGRTYLESLCEYPDKAVRDMVIDSGMESGMQESYDALEQVAAALTDA